MQTGGLGARFGVSATLMVEDLRARSDRSVSRDWPAKRPSALKVTPVSSSSRSTDQGVCPSGVGQINETHIRADGISGLPVLKGDLRPAPMTSIALRNPARQASGASSTATGSK